MKLQFCLLLSVLCFISDCRSEPSPQPNPPNPAVVPIIPPQPDVPVIPSPQPGVVPVIPPQPDVPVVPSPQPGVVPVIPSPQPGVVPVIPSPQPGVVPVIPSPQPSVVPVVPPPQPSVVPVVPQPSVVPVVPPPQPSVVPVVPQPSVVPQPNVPVVPQPGVEPTPGVQPNPEPVPNIPNHNFFITSLSEPSPFQPTSFGAIHYTNHNLFFFGGYEPSGSMSSQIIQFNLLTYTWTNISDWDTDKSVLCYSQPVSDTITNYPTSFIWANSTDLSYYLTQFDAMLDWNFTVELPGSGSKMDISLAATSSGSAFILEENSFKIYYFNSSSKAFIAVMNANSPPPVSRYDPAVVAYNNGFYMHGGHNGGMVYSDLWYFEYTNSTWTNLGNFFSASDHQAHVVNIETNTTIYFTGVNDSAGIYIYDINTNTLTPFTLSADNAPRYGSVSTTQGNRLYLFGGEKGNNQIWRFIDERYCRERVNCTDCSSAYSCGWCPSPFPNRPSCITALDSISLLNNTCLVQSVFTHALLCPEDEFSKAAIAFINLGFMLLFGIIFFIIIKVRSVKKASKGYTAV